MKLLSGAVLVGAILIATSNLLGQRFEMRQIDLSILMIDRLSSEHGTCHIGGAFAFRQDKRPTRKPPARRTFHLARDGRVTWPGDLADTRGEAPACDGRGLNGKRCDGIAILAHAVNVQVQGNNSIDVGCDAIVHHTSLEK